MATEPKVEISSEASVPSIPQPAAKVDSEPKDGEAQQYSLNGTATADELENKHISDIVDDLVHSAEVSISGGSAGGSVVGSDTEASRAESSRSKDDKGHVRTSSTVKKPTSFKSVSVNKTFLAAKGATTTAPSKTGDKVPSSTGTSTTPTGSPSLTARPRLVAKSGSSLRDSSRTPGANGKAGSVPDGNVVWNKNRPPEPKKFTDEELKKYGIHMANRLHPDDAKGQANNWADIEDDDEDWAPETITWTDGTKITLPHPDEHPPTPAPEESVPAPPPAKENRTIEKPKSPAPHVGSPSVRSSVLSSGKGLILKGAPEKPTLVAKPPAPPTPVKSPWASIPKVETVSPMVAERAANQSPSRMLPMHTTHVFKNITPEIAADDFSRSGWRDGATHGNRELFNSQSGRYEPVTDRRGSGGPRAQGNPQWLPRVSPALMHATPHYSPTTSDVVPVPSEQQPVAPPREDDYEFQKKVMRERREMAMKRRLEQEAREEAERKERIRLKLEAMGPPPERKSTKKETTAAESKAKQPSQAATAQNLSPRIEKKTEVPPNGVPSPVPSDAQAVPPTEPALAPPDNKHGHPWPGRMAGQPDRFSTWGAGPQPSRNVWGSPNNDRSLGNGTFNADLSRVPDPHTSQLPQARNVPGPGPIGPPSSAKTSASGGEGAVSRPAPIGPPQSRSRYGGPTSRSGQPQQRTADASAWIAAVQQSDSELAIQQREKHAQRERDLEARGLTHADVQSTIKDTWRPTTLDSEGQRVSTQEADKSVHGPKTQTAGSWGVQPNDRQAQGAAHRQAVPAIGQNGPSPTPQQPRGSSRFFPSRDVRQEDSAHAGISRPHSPSPPPPDMDGHPAFDGDAAHPLVTLPPTKPVVRLPPAPGAASAALPRQPNFNWATPPPFKDGGGAHAHLSRQSPTGHSMPQHIPPTGQNWQEKFNNLLTGRKSSPPKPVAIDSSSRNALAPSIQHVPATVSLPSASRTNTAAVDNLMVTKLMDEDCFEEQEMGSLPQIRIPQKTPEALWQPALPAKPIPRRFMVATPTSAEPVHFVPEGSVMRVWFPGMSEAKSVTIPYSRTRSNPRRGRGGPRYASASQRPPNKGRDPSSSYPPDHPSGPGSSGPHPSRGGRGGYRGRTDNWSRRASTPIQT
ncbi:hypothetical protein NKR23_g4607 [Pleurostoma richardsiae]|uniref:Uncharacterized protein n=1 Tax=Pleurostoma richardsiae TaxID=41990 RepID=A0AA38RIS8_9PEZI|nr:hypothetical protein NKR23_g4607 [Pleurostoma richardsiae]